MALRDICAKFSLVKTSGRHFVHTTLKFDPMPLQLIFKPQTSSIETIWVCFRSTNQLTNQPTNQPYGYASGLLTN